MKDVIWLCAALICGYLAMSSTIRVWASSAKWPQRILEGIFAMLFSGFLFMLLILIYAGEGHASHWRLEWLGQAVEMTVSRGGAVTGTVNVPELLPLAALLPILLGAVIAIAYRYAVARGLIKPPARGLLVRSQCQHEWQLLFAHPVTFEPLERQCRKCQLRQKAQTVWSDIKDAWS